MSLVTIRPFVDSDAVAVLHIHGSAILAVADDFYSAAERQSWAHGLAAEGYIAARDGGETFIVAVEDDVAVGFCSVTTHQIIGLYVAPDHQGQGIGKSLLAAAEAVLIDAGTTFSRIHASVSAVQFYESNGYCVTGQTNHISRGGLAMAGTLLEKAIGR